MIKEMIKEMLMEELFGSKENKKTDKCDYKGQLVLVRTYSAGVHFGTLESKKGKEVKLVNAHRIYSWVNACSLSQLATQASQGMESQNKISVSVPEILLTEAIEIIPISSDVFTKLTSTIWQK